MHLYELSEAYKTLSVLALDDENFDVETLKTELANVTTELKDKVENIALLCKQLEYDDEILNTEIERLSKREKTISGKMKWFKSYLQNEMQNAKIDSVKKPLAYVSLCKNSKPTVIIIDESKVPHELCDYEPEKWKPNKDTILKSFKDNQGVVPDGVEIITDKKHVVIS